MTIDENPWSRILLIDILMIDNKEETKKIFDSLNQILKDKKIEQSIGMNSFMPSNVTFFPRSFKHSS